ncbi:MAG: helix-hairpin-helix domain-containing protein [Candidatus Omnitrophica bacterium]|nr:helix-hairpin-helix domain-containing protein [Candidatus Omnitrophota bacterium]MDD5652536.1 helix-hairpin-helix domain-containing protein [Candidatus Omnitrophota bacterium]
MLNFTRQEQQVALFLVAITLLGTGINFLAKKYSPIRSIAVADPQIIKIDLNQADKKELISVPGIGEKLAERILEVRKDKLRFLLLEELKGIPGMTEARFAKIKDYLAIK